MQLVSISDVVVADRQRTSMSPKELEELKRSIASSKGLLHAPVVSFIDGIPHLVAGERRLTAMAALHEAGLPFTHNGEIVPEGEMPYVQIKDLSALELAEAELEENVIRADLSWQDETLAKKKIYELRMMQNPDTTVSDVAREIVERAPETTDARSPTGKASFNSERVAIAESLIVADHLNDPKVQRARSRKEAYKIILDKVENSAKAQGVVQAMKGFDVDHQIIFGDCLKELKKIPTGTVDTIICDPPYGMKADKMGKGEFHMYDDSPETALDVCKAIFTEGFRICKPKAVLFMFCDIDHFVTLRTFAAQQAWTVWRTPITWVKGTDGHSPWGRAGFVRTTELLLFAVKGQKELVYPGGPDVLNYKRTSRGERLHSAEKPVSMLEHLIHISTLPGMTILDPTAGSGPIITAASNKSCKVIAIEKDKSSYEYCLQRLSPSFRSTEDAEPDAISELLDD